LTFYNFFFFFFIFDFIGSGNSYYEFISSWFSLLFVSVDSLYYKYCVFFNTIGVHQTRSISDTLSSICVQEVLEIRFSDSKISFIYRNDNLDFFGSEHFEWGGFCFQLFFRNICTLHFVELFSIKEFYNNILRIFKTFSFNYYFGFTCQWSQRGF